MILFDVPYRAFLGLSLNGNNYANAGMVCLSGGHHYEYYGNQVTGVIYSGLESSQCGDYYTYLNNWVWLNGENPNGLVTIGSNAGSGITVNQAIALPGDTYTGLHNVFANNIVTGQFDPTSGHTDGVGISLDLVKTQTLGGSLVVNNVVYGNGGRCIEINSGYFYPNDVFKNVIVANNTCYMNDLDLTVTTQVVQFENNESTNVYYINNIAVAWPGWNGTVGNWYENGTTGTVWAGGNIWYNGAEGVSQSLINTDPLFVNPPVYDPSAGLQYADGLPPATLGNGLQVRAGSPAVGAGIDPTTLPGIAGTQIAADMTTYVYSDITGNSRASGSAFTLGAYNAEGSAP